MTSPLDRISVLADQAEELATALDSVNRKRRDLAVKAYAEGATLAEVTEAARVSARTVTSWLHKGGAALHSSSSRRIRHSADFKAEAVRAYRNRAPGVSREDLAAEFGIDPVTLYRWDRASG